MEIKEDQQLEAVTATYSGCCGKGVGRQDLCFTGEDGRAYSGRKGLRGSLMEGELARVGHPAWLLRVEHLAFSGWSQVGSRN